VFELSRFFSKSRAKSFVAFCPAGPWSKFSFFFLSATFFFLLLGFFSIAQNGGGPSGLCFGRLFSQSSGIPPSSAAFFVRRFFNGSSPLLGGQALWVSSIRPPLQNRPCRAGGGNFSTTKQHQ